MSDRIERVAIDENDPAELLMKSELPQPGAGCGPSLPVSQALRLADFAAKKPRHYRTLRAQLIDPSATQRQLADRLRISQSTVARHQESARAELRQRDEDEYQECRMSTEYWGFEGYCKPCCPEFNKCKLATNGHEKKV